MARHALFVGRLTQRKTRSFRLRDAAPGRSVRYADPNPVTVSFVVYRKLGCQKIREMCAMNWDNMRWLCEDMGWWHHFPAAALDILRAVPRLNEGHHAFAVGLPGALTYRTVRHHFGDAVRLAGLSDVRLHDLRRTFMTNAAAAGVGTHVLRDLLGHKSTAMADRYVRSVGRARRPAR